MLTTFFLVQLPRSTKKQKKMTWRQLITTLDLLGNFLLLPAMVCLLLALQWGGTMYAWKSWRCILLFCIFGVFGTAWGYVQVNQGENATVPMRLLKMRSMLAAMWFAFCLFGMLFVVSYYVPVWFQAVRGESAYKTGISMLASTIAMTVFFPVAGKLVRLPCQDRDMPFLPSIC